MLINIPRGQLSPGYALRGIKLYTTEKENIRTSKLRVSEMWAVN